MTGDDRPNHEHAHGVGPTRHGTDQPKATHHDAPAGLTVAADGLLLSPEETTIEPGEPHEWRFQVVDEDGRPVTSFDDQHGASLHLVLVRRDLAHFQHLHPTMDAGGTWTEALVLPAPGVYRAFTDVSVGGQSTTLGVDLFAPGEMDLADGVDVSARKRVGDFGVAIDDGEVRAGQQATLRFDVTGADGNPAHLEPYLEARGHLVALREGDLAYLHVHPVETDPGEGHVSFRATFPNRGRYRLYLQIRPEGELVTTWFDVRVGGRGEG